MDWNSYIKDIEKGMKDIPEDIINQVGGKDSPIMGFIKGFNLNMLTFATTVLPGFMKLIPYGFDEMSDHIKSNYKEPVQKATDNALQVIKGYGFIDDAGVKALNEIANTFGIFKLPLLIGIIIFITVSYVKGVTQATGGKAMQKYSAAFSPYAIDAGSAVRAAFVAPEDYKKAYDALRRNGLSDEDITMLFKASYSLLDEDTLRSLYYRGEMTEAEVQRNMRQRGYTDSRIASIMKTWAIIPPVQDIITMAVREAFSPDQIRSLGLAEALPGEYVEWAKKMGLSSEWAERYWYAHWQLPSATMGFEMLHRKKITKDELRDLLKALDYSPRWHEPLMEISYNVMTRVDVRRLFELGLLTEDELQTKYEEMGYSPDDATLLRRWTVIEYNAEYKDLTKSEVIKQYQEGIISETECYSLLQFMGYSIDRIDTMIALANYERAYAKQTTLIAALKKLYISGEYSANEVNVELAPYNIDPRRIDEMMDTWNIERKAGITLPKKTELDDWLSKGIINSAEYVDEMKRIGYSDKNIARYVKALTSTKESK